MKTILFNLALFLNCTLVFASSNPFENTKIEKKKVYKKEYNVNSNNTLKVSNQYGDVKITTWKENKIEIEVTVTASAKDEKWADQKLEDIKIYMSQNGNIVNAYTEISSNNWNWFSNKNIQFKINYAIKMPITNHIEINNDYGYVYIPDLEGDSNISCDYGGVTIGQLKSNNNVLNIDYCNNSSIEYAKNIKVNADYSTLSMTTIDNITLNADYSNTTIDAVGALSYSADYGNLKIKNANVIIGSNDYLNLSIGQINKRLDINCDYGNLKIDRVSKNFESIKIQSDYLSIKLGLESSTKFTFDLQNEYAQISIDGFSPKYTSKSLESFEKKYKGFVDDENASPIKIQSSYGNIDIYAIK